jgi:toxin ParE1/3/4
MAEVIWTETALKHVRDIWNYIAQDYPERADVLVDRLMEAPDLLRRNPKLGRRVPEFSRENIRELVMVRPYRIVYVIRDETCYISGVFHGRRDLSKLLNPKEFEEM